MRDAEWYVFVTDYFSYGINAARVYGVCCILQLTRLLFGKQYCRAKGFIITLFCCGGCHCELRWRFSRKYVAFAGCRAVGGCVRVFLCPISKMSVVQMFRSVKKEHKRKPRSDLYNLWFSKHHKVVVNWKCFRVLRCGLVLKSKWCKAATNCIVRNVAGMEEKMQRHRHEHRGCKCVFKTLLFLVSVYFQ